MWFRIISVLITAGNLFKRVNEHDIIWQRQSYYWFNCWYSITTCHGNICRTCLRHTLGTPSYSHRYVLCQTGDNWIGAFNFEPQTVNSVQYSVFSELCFYKFHFNGRMQIIQCLTIKQTTQIYRCQSNTQSCTLQKWLITNNQLLIISWQTVQSKIQSKRRNVMFDTCFLTKTCWLQIVSSISPKLFFGNNNKALPIRWKVFYISTLKINTTCPQAKHVNYMYLQGRNANTRKR